MSQTTQPRDVNSAMMIVNLNSGKQIDANEIEFGTHTVKLLDRNGDVMHRIGQPLVDSITTEQV